MKQAIYILCLYIGIVTLATLSLLGQPLEIRLAVSVFAALIIAGILLLVTRSNKTRYGSF